MEVTQSKLENNVFYKARKKAAQWNDRLNSRDGASELLGYQTHSMMTDWELDNKIPSPENVNRMADLYNAPELRPYYCQHLCPLGHDWPSIDPGSIESLDRITINVLKVLTKSDETKMKLLEIASDGKITPDEHDTLMAVINTLREMETASQSLRLWLNKRKQNRG